MPRYCAHLGYTFTEVPLEERFAAAAGAGFAHIEHPSPYGMGAARFRGQLQAHGLSCAQIAAPSGDAAKGEKGLACLPGREDDFRQSVEAGIAMAHEIGTALLHVMPGVVLGGVDQATYRDTYLANMAWAANACAKHDITVLIEPISDETVPGFFVNHPHLALELLAEIDADNVRLLFDVYHCALKGVDPVAFIQDHIGLIAHVQIADFPGRHEPGTGDLPFARIFGALDDLGYGGVVGGEYKPKADTLSGLSWRADFA